MPVDDVSTIAFTPRAWVFVFAVVLIAVAGYAYYRTTPSVHGRLRGILVGLRVAAFILIAALLLDPRLIHHDTRTDAPKVVAMVDRSASMGLGSGAWDDPTAPTRFDRASEIARALADAVKDAGAIFELTYFASDLDEDSDTIRADGQGTDIATSLQSVARQYEGENLTAVVLLSDGIDTDESLIRKSIPEIPVFAVGLGDTAAPEDVRIDDVEYSSVVRVPSRTSIRASVGYTGSRQKHVRLRLSEGGKTVFQADTLLTPGARRFEREIPVRFREIGRREFQLSVEVDGHDAEPENNTRDIVIEGEKAKTKILIVDLLPSWELHFLTEFLKRDQTFDYAVVTMPARSATEPGKLRPPEEFVEALADADALVLGSISDGFFTQQVANAIITFVRERGGGMLVLPGESSLFEKAAAWQRIDEIMPLRGNPPFRFNLQYTSLLPGAQAAGNPITSHLMPVFSQTEWQERSPLLGYYTSVAPKQVSEVLLNVKGRSLPAFAYQTVGKGRVAAFTAGPLWRWKFLSESNGVYDEVVSRLLDVLSRGEDTDRFVLMFEKNVFDAGESASAYAEIFNEKMQPVTSVPVRIEVARVDGAGAETPLQMVTMRREDTQSTRFKSTLAPLPPGRYIVRGRAELPDRTITSQPAEIQVSTNSVEFARVNQNRAGLVSIARRTGGSYVPASAGDAVVSSIVREAPLESRATPTVSEINIRTTALLFLIILALLSTEWLLRKRAGMI